MHGRSFRAFLGLIVAAVVLVIPVAGAAQAGEPQNPRVQDRGRPNPAGQRACSTVYGLCRIADGTPPGQPCYCHYANGQWVGGYAREWNWEFKPFDTK